MLGALGYALDLERCVVCGRECPGDKAACVDPARGGLVCRACGGAATVLLPAARALARALVAATPAAPSAAAGRSLADPGVDDRSARALLDVVDRAMAAHAGFER